MATPGRDWLGRHPLLVIAVFAIAVLVISAESFYINQQRMVGKSRREHSDALLTTFLLGDTAQVAGGSSVHIRFQNVRFKWSQKVYIDAGSLAVRAVSVRGAAVDFDDVASFQLVLQQAVVRIPPEVLAGMFNESVFNYPGSRVRDLKVAIERGDGGDRLVVLRGKVSVLAWVPFTMYTRLGVDPTSNTLVIAVDHLKVFGILPATKLIRWTPLHLDRLIALPPNQSLWVDGNRILVKPFGLFPPPRLNGRIASVAVEDHEIDLSFAGDAITAPVSTARNYVYLRGGTSQFGQFRMADTDLLIIDRNQADPFSFSLLHYTDLLGKSTVELPDTRSARITMPDF